MKQDIKNKYPDSSEFLTLLETKDRYFMHYTALNAKDHINYTKDIQKKLFDLWYDHGKILKVLFQVPIEKLEGKLKNQALELTQNSFITNKEITFTKDPAFYSGHCPNTQKNHLWSLITENNTFIRINNYISASLKYNGRYNIVGLQTIQLPDGTFPIIKGGIYRPSQKLFDEIQYETDVEPKVLEIYPTSKIIDRDKLNMLGY